MSLRKEKEIREVYDKLEKCRERYDFKSGVSYVEFCLYCKRDITDENWLDHSDHATVFSDFDHDGIGSFMKGLDWVLKELHTQRLVKG